MSSNHYTEVSNIELAFSYSLLDQKKESDARIARLIENYEKKCREVEKSACTEEECKKRLAEALKERYTLTDRVVEDRRIKSNAMYARFQWELDQVNIKYEQPLGKIRFI
jgi:hypothetical protein